MHGEFLPASAPPADRNFPGLREPLPESAPEKPLLPGGMCPAVLIVLPGESLFWNFPPLEVLFRYSAPCSSASPFFWYDRELIAIKSIQGNKKITRLFFIYML